MSNLNNPDHNPLKLDLIRKERNKLLKLSDIYVLPDYPHLNDTVRQNWITYRQALRDIPNNLDISTVLFDEDEELTGVNWPTPPS